jgi:Flp pilus assembly protein TadG
MKPPFICRQPFGQTRRSLRVQSMCGQAPHRSRERGVTMALVAAAMVAIMAMAALSIDAVTLYLANAEAQRTADAAALAAARVISVSGITGTASTATQPPYWQSICGGSSSLATQTAQAVATQNPVGGATATTTVNYAIGSGTPNTDCSTLGAGFAVNPLVIVKVQNNLPTFFARIWGKTGSSVSATAAAEAFNPSNSAAYVASGIVPVQPRCVKPWIVPNFDPLNPQPVSNPSPPPALIGYCTSGTCATLADLSTGSITTPGISLSGTGANGVIGETLTLVPDCNPGGDCSSQRNNPPIPNRAGLPLANLEYLPGQVSQPSSAVPSDGTDACGEATSNYAQAIAGCDQTTTYKCGLQKANTVDLSENPRTSGDTANGVQCLIHQGTLGLGSSSGQDIIDTTNYPFQIKAGDNNPLNITGNVITTSNSVVTVPIYDNKNNTISSSGTSPVTIVGFMEVFIHAVDGAGDMRVTVLNVSGCGNGNNPTGNPVFGSSPVPVRLVTPP